MNKNLLLGIAVIALGASAAAQEAALPNIVIVYADDLGYGDLSCYNPECAYETPRLDRMAAEGVRFTDAHSPSTICSPSRYGLLSGQQIYRSTGRGGGAFEGPGGPSYLKPGTLTLGCMLKAKGYRTGVFGKWHVGLTWLDEDGKRLGGGFQNALLIDYEKSTPLVDGPNARGFDESFVTPNCPTTDPLYVYIENGMVPSPASQRHRRSNLPNPGGKWRWDNDEGWMAPDYRFVDADLLFYDKALEFITEHRETRPEQPFFVLLSTQIAHAPVLPAPGFEGKTDAGARGDFVRELDVLAGRLLDALDDLGIGDDTLVLFNADNGPETVHTIWMRQDHGHDAAGGFRGMKRDGWEGGHRVPFLARWPGRIPAGQVTGQLTNTTDIFATLASVVGYELPDEVATDSFDMLPAMLGTQNEAEPIRPHMLTQSFRGEFQIRQGTWKYLDHVGSGGNGYDREPMKAYALPETAPEAPGQLYDLAKDPGETTNLYFTEEARREELQQLLERLKSSGRSAPRGRRPIGIAGIPKLAQAKPGGHAVLGSAALRAHVRTFNRNDHTHLGQAIANADTADWMAANVPLFACPDQDVEEIYHFRWWTFRKHLKQTPDGYVITEFLPKVNWSGRHNTISCPAGHHFREGRWIRDRSYLDDYAVFWFRKGGSPRRYSFWAADAVHQYALARGDFALAIDLLPDLVANYEAWEEARLEPDGLFWQIDDRDGMEVSIGGRGHRGRGRRATINSYLYGDARAIAAIAERAGRSELAASYGEKAARLRRLVLDKLWDDEAKFFKVLPRGEEAELVDVRELHGFTPWYFGLPPQNAGYEVAWRQLMDPEGFFAPFGPTTAEQRHPGFVVSYEGHECQWNGPSWPFATAVTLTALANVLHDYPQQAVSPQDYLETLKTYTRSHRLRSADGVVVPWIDENLNPQTGDWIARTRLSTWKDGTWDPGKGGVERGKDYNHSTYCDLIITGLVGLRPRADDIVEVHPLLPDGAWDHFCLDGVPYHGRTLTVLYDETGERYGRGKGLRILADGREIGARETLGRLLAPLPPLPGTGEPREKPGGEARDEAHFDPVIKDIEGWTVHVDPQLLEGEHAEEGGRALAMLANHLQRIAILLPEDRLAEVRQLEIWIEHDHPDLNVEPGPYHPGAGWLTARGYDPRLAKKVHITRAASLLERHHMIKHPAVILHELAHAYHHQVLGFDEPRIQAAYDKAMQAGLYDEVLLYTGKKVRAYAATNPLEYFAEGTEAYFYRNDFYPFVRAELAQHDPVLHDLLEEIWGPLR